MLVHRIIVLIYFLILLFSVTFSQSVVSLKIDGVINPAAAAFIERGIENAECHPHG